MANNHIFKYNPELREIARQLRNNATTAERLLWYYLRGKQRQGFDFHRQKPIDQFILDFYCPELKLAIEIDGESHSDKFDIDKDRQLKLESLGLSFLRFDDLDVKKNIEGVIIAIDNWIKAHN